jgi:hypothetical protein
MHISSVKRAVGRDVPITLVSCTCALCKEHMLICYLDYLRFQTFVG